jgi:hypothetical protein
VSELHDSPQSRHNLRAKVDELTMIGDQFSTTRKLRLISEGEGPTVEFKSSLPPEGQIASNLAAFANTSGGTFIIGVSDTGEIVGLSPEEAEQATQRFAAITAKIMPGRILHIRTIPISGRLIVVAVVAPPATDDPPVITATGQLSRETRFVLWQIPALLPNTSDAGSLSRPRPAVRYGSL